MKANLKRYRALALCCLIVIMAGGLSSCTSIAQYEEFHPCVKDECPKCLGERVYTCPTCKGRGWLPPSFSAGIGISSHHGNGHHHVSRGTGFGITFSSCPRCDRRGIVRCGTTTFYWKCKKCNTQYDEPVQPCPTCGAR